MAEDAAQAVAQRHVGADGEALQYQEENRRAKNQDNQRIAVKPVAETAPGVQLAVFLDRHGFNVAEAAMVEVAGKLVMHRVRTPPMIIGRKRQHTDQPAKHFVGGA
jgi:hypothetical protein